MDNEMNVKLGLDTSSYEKSIDGALKVFNSFQTKLNDTKLGFSSSQISELHKIFTDIRSTATSELAKIQKRIDSLNGKNVKLDFEYNTTAQKIEDLQKEIEVTWSATQRAKLENRLDALQQKLDSLNGELTLNDEDLKEAETDYNFLLKELQVNPLEFDFESPSLIKFNTMIDNVLNGLKRTGEEAEDTGDKIDEMGKKAEGAARTSTKLNLMGRMLSQIKNTIAAALNPLNQFRKLWNNIIMTDNSKFGNTFKTIAANIQTALTPVFERIAQGIINLIGYINVFVKALSGGKTDLFAKTSKSAANTAKSMKEANKQLAGFDEINDISESSGGSSSDGTGNVGIVEPNLKGEWVEKLTEWGKNLNKFWEKIKEVFGWIKDHVGILGLIALGILGVVGALIILNKITGGIAGPLIGIGVALAGLALVLYEVSNVLQTFQQLGLKTNDALKLLGGVLGIVVASMGAMAIIGKVLGSDPLILIGILALALSLSLVLEIIADTLPTILDSCGKFIEKVAPYIIGILTTIGNLINDIIHSLGESLPPIIESVGNIFTKIFNGISKCIGSVGKVIVNILSAIGGLVNTVLNSIVKFINDLGPAINNFVDNTISAVTKLINFLISGIEYMVNTLVIDGVNAIIKGINKIGKYVGFTIPVVPDFTIRRFVPKLDTGTGYVPQDMLAYIHQGEAVIPKEFNNKEYFGGTNEETNRLLYEVIDAINNIEINPYTTVKDVGKAAVNYINDKNRTMGRSMI